MKFLNGIKIPNLQTVFGSKLEIRRKNPHLLCQHVEWLGDVVVRSVGVADLWEAEAGVAVLRWAVEVSVRILVALLLVVAVGLRDAVACVVAWRDVVASALVEGGLLMATPVHL
jgi:hypothetical protein